MKYSIIIFCLALLISGCGKTSDKLHEEGVSLELARFRAARYCNVKYELFFSIPKDKFADVRGTSKITFYIDRITDIIVDFTGEPDDIKEVSLNGKEIEYNLQNQHIVIPGKYAVKGENSVYIEFGAGDQSLNRRDEFLYTLLVPDRARTLFPCFDQPDLKANFSLTLEVPLEWEAIGNGSVTEVQYLPDGRKLVSFKATEPIPTYLFSFVAGVFDKITDERGGRSVSLYHRETDPDKIAQCPTIFNELFHALAWLEEYTGIAYPFEKYDLILIPGFQYGGMEHMGATLYSDSRMFIEQNATIDERLKRSSLIAHETAHMWFGDYVTMRWFNDVWNKEVFANWFAAKIVEPMYPDVQHRLNFIISNYPPAYAEDRTGGAMPIQQHLGNLRDAGLIYSNIVYNKSPIVMDMLVRKVGESSFREAIREYLSTYAYGNADWDDLIAILDARTDEDLRKWSDTWIKQKGMPTVWLKPRGESLVLTQSDPWGRGVVWDQTVRILAYRPDTLIFSEALTFRKGGNTIPADLKDVSMNPDCNAYGYFKHKNKSWDFDDGMPYFMNYYEALMNREVSPEHFLENIMVNLKCQCNVQLFTQALAYAESCVNLFLRGNTLAMMKFDSGLIQIVDYGSETSTPALKVFCRTASTPDGIAKLYEIWSEKVLKREYIYEIRCNSSLPSIQEEDGEPNEVWTDRTVTRRYPLSERDLITASYTLAIHMPDKAEEIVAEQLSRITNPDRRKEYEFVSQAVDPSQDKRDAFFESLLLAENRTVEPWVVQALRLLNHPARERESLKYIRPGLDALRDIQRTGDIFLPANWCSALLGGHTSPDALEIVKEFFASNPEYPQLLASKIKIKADHLYIVNNRLQDRYK